MLNAFAKNIELALNISEGKITSFKLGGKERVFAPCSIFRIRLRDLAGGKHYLLPNMANIKETEKNTLIYKDFSGDFKDLTVKVTLTAGDSLEWQIEISPVLNTYAIEWVEFPKINFPRLKENNENGGRILFPYNEGMIVSDESLLPRYEPEFPSSGAYFTFPNMVCSQFMAYLFDDVGLYMGAHDEKRALKGVDFYPEEDELSLQFRLYTGANYGEGYKQKYPIVWKACTNAWKSGAEIYRSWLQDNLPKKAIPISKNESLPKWYRECPLIVTYPVRGVHDMDKMEPNALYPYTNAIPLLSKIKEATQCQIMALLMHWEGTAPWAPPYVWPPYGGEEKFFEFRDKLHENNDLLGVYCSGFGYTLKSTLTDYNCEEKIKEENVLSGVCHSPENKPELGITCTPYQRYGYDICPASKRGKEILNEAYPPLFKTGIDYAQILDQNHGGGQYMCYAREHGHPPMPGEWMTSNMQNLLSQWNDDAKNMIFGCESAAAEPFIGNLLMSDNRFELNYPFGDVVPLYAFLYHEYLRNFMGNQCGCPFEPSVDTLRYRLAYSFSIGDIMTLIVAPDGRLMTHWGTHDFDSAPDFDLTLKFIKNMREFYEGGAKKYLLSGKMACADDISCEKITIPLFRGRKFATLPRLISSVWENEGALAYVVINPENEPASFEINGESYTVEGLSGMIIEK